VRAIAICQEASKKYEDRDWIKIKGEDAWKRVQHMVVDGAEGEGPTWVRGAGDPEAWKVNIPFLITHSLCQHDGMEAHVQSLTKNYYRKFLTDMTKIKVRLSSQVPHFLYSIPPRLFVWIL
jgi:hypothetical protein